MLEKTMKYKNYNDEEIEQTFYFHLTKAEILEMEFGTSGGVSAALEKIVKAKDVPELIKNFKIIVDSAYGVKTPDGKFYKSEQLLNEFKATSAYSDLFTELITSSKAASDFVNSIVPKDMRLSDSEVSNLMSAIQ